MNHKKLTNYLRYATLLCLMVFAYGSAWGEDSSWTYTFVSPDKIADNIITVNKATWNVATTTGAGSPTITTGTCSSKYGLKFGSSKSVYYGSVTLTTNYFTDKNVKSVAVNFYNNGSKSGTLTAKQGDTTIGTVSKTFGQTWNVLTASGTTGNGGDLVLTYSVAQAFYINSITVTYEEGESAVSITTQPIGATYTQGDEATPLSIVAAGSPTPTYQWYSNTSENTEGASAIVDATSAFYTPGTDAVGTTYYYCVAKNTTTAGEQTATSDIVSVIVNAATGHKVTTTASPAEGGNVSAEPYNNIAEGIEVKLTATPNDGYEFVSWYAIDGNAEEVTVTDDKFNMPGSDVEAEATFSPILVTSVTLSKTELSLQKGYSETLTATVSPGNALVKTITWISSDNSIATVDQTGKVTGVKKGEVNITATSSNGIVGTCVVTVIAAIPWEKVTIAPEDWSGNYLLVYNNSNTEAYVWTGVDAGNCYVKATITNNTINQPANAVSVTIAPIEGGYSIKVNGGENDEQYIGQTASKNGIEFSSDGILNKLSYSSNATVISSGTTAMRFNTSSGQTRFRYFTSSTGKAIQLYKQVSSEPSVTLDQQTLSLSAGTTAKLTATVKNSETTAAWSSDAEGIATVDQNGKVTAIAEGTATITAKITEEEVDYTATCTVTVTPAATVTSVIISPETVAPFYVGKTVTLTAAVEGANSPSQSVTWSSSDEQVAMVADGIVTGIKAGTATITATSAIDGTKFGTRNVEVITTANTEATAYTTAEVIELIDASKDNDILTATVFVKGQISKVDSFDDESKSITYWLDTNTVEVYAGRGLSNSDFVAITNLSVGDKVVITGNVKKYSSTYEFAGGNYLVDIEHGTMTNPAFEATTYKTALEVGTPDQYTINYNGDGTISAKSSAESVATVVVDGTDVTVTPLSEGSATITLNAPETNKYYGAQIQYTVKVTVPYSKDDYLAVVSKYSDKYYAMGNTCDDGTVNAVEVSVVNDKVITTYMDPAAISWKLAGDSYVKNANGKFISYSSTTVSLDEETSKTFTENNDDDGFYWESSSRTFIYRKNINGFRTYNASNAGYSGYGTIGYLMTLSDGYTRSTTSGHFGTVCLPYTVNAIDIAGATFYTVAGKRIDASGNVTSIVLQEVEGALTAGTPYIFKATASSIVLAYTGSPVTNPVAGANGLTGTFSEITSIDNGSIVFSGAKFYTVDGTVKCGANRAYINAANCQVYSDTAAKGVIEITTGNEATGIMTQSDIRSTKTATGYRLNGQAVGKDYKGIVIVNGRKVLNK